MATRVDWKLGANGCRGASCNDEHFGANSLTATSRIRLLLSGCLRASRISDPLSSPYDPFNDWGGGRGCNNFVPVLGGNGTKIASTGDIFYQPPCQMR